MKKLILNFILLCSLASVAQRPTNYIPHGGRHYFSDSIKFNKTISAPNTPIATNGISVVQLNTNGLFVRDTSCGKPWCTGGNAPTNSTSFIGTTNSKDLVFKTKNTEAMRIDTNGNVGIGVAVPTAKLHVLQTDTNTSVLRIDNYNSGILIDIGTGENPNILFGDLNSNFNSSRVSLDDANKICNITYDTTAVINLGVNTSSPTSKLHVNGDVRIEGTDSVTIYAKTPANGTFEYCTDCTGNGITGRLLGYIGSAWRRFTIE